MVDQKVVRTLVEAGAFSRQAADAVRASVTNAARAAGQSDPHAAAKINPAYRAAIAAKDALCHYLIHSLEGVETVEVDGDEWDKDRAIAELWK